ncbi:MAG: Ig-like domain repeat protein [Pseudomonadota bacterium]|nr:Ig-like domain repeat protein [Pseudomonadota bacterium]
MNSNHFTWAIVAALAFAILHAQPVLAHDAAAQPLRAQAEFVATSPAATETLTGTVHEVILDDATRGTSSRYVELQLDDGTLVPLRGDATAALKSAARVTVSGRHDGERLDVEAAQTVAAAATDSATKANAEIEGTLAVLHGDDFAGGKSTYFYEVHQSSGKVNRLRMGSLPAPLAPGMRVRVIGRADADGESVTPDRITILAQPATSSAGSTIAKAATANNVLVIMANFNNTAVPAFTSAQAQQVMTTNADSVANFFREASYGQQLMNVTVTPAWVTMNLAQPATCGSSDWQAISSSAEAAARTLGSAYDPATYNFVVYVFPTVPSCGWLGLAYIGFPHKSWINGLGAFKTSAIAHEMGHNFGLLHAASLRCGTGIIGGSCSASEYGDPFDTMGNQRAMHYNAMQKSKLAWIPSTSVKTHTGGSVTYTLSPLEVAGGTTYAVKIPTTAANRTYWLEFRQPIGFDSPLSDFPNNGVEIRVSSPFETLCSGCDSWSDDTELLDMTPATSGFTDATLAAGQMFSDPTYSVNVIVLAASASALTVQVTTGGATPPMTSTTTTIASMLNPSITGAGTTFAATVTGNSPTGTVRFTDNGGVIVGCAAVGLTGGSATCSTNALITGTHAIAAAYSGDAANAASTSATLTQVVNAPVNGTNVALASNGGTASASSMWGPSFPPSAVIDNQRSGAGWGNYAGWADGTSGAFPDWMQINFNGPKTIDHVVVYSVQDNYLDPVEPTDSMIATRFALSSYDVQGWNGTSWVTLASVSANNLVKRTVSFSPYTTDRIRIYITGTQDGLWSRITEVEAWSSSTTTETNFALAANGGVALASSTWGPSFAPSGVIDNLRSGAGWGNYAGWADGTAGVFPDWLQINFNRRGTIDHIVVYSVQDNYLSPAEPTDSMLGTRFALSSFDVQGWDGSNWITVASVSGNKLIKRTVWFNAYSTDRIRIYITGTQDGVWSRVTEVEAWGT